MKIYNNLLSVCLYACIDGFILTVQFNTAGPTLIVHIVYGNKSNWKVLDRSGYQAMSLVMLTLVSSPMYYAWLKPSLKSLNRNN